jgi:glucarate dehydratase
MHITDMHITPIAITDPPLLNAAGLHAPYALRIIVELVTNDNIYGLGEVPGSIETEEALKAAREAVIGKDPFQLNRKPAHHAGKPPGISGGWCMSSAR